MIYALLSIGNVTYSCVAEKVLALKYKLLLVGILESIGKVVHIHNIALEYVDAMSIYSSPLQQ